MRLVVLPLRELSSTKSFLFATASAQTNPDVKPTLQERVVNKASSTWLGWEAATGGWKKKVVVWGNKAISRIDYREHSLKTVMSIATYEKYHPNALKANINVAHPTDLQSASIKDQIATLAREGVPRHRQKLIYSFILMPFTAPFMLVPVVPNLPFFYVAFRAWSHWRAMQGSAHLQQLIEQDRLTLTPSKSLRGVYDGEGKMVPGNLGRVLQDKISVPGMILEVERASQQLDRIDANVAAQVTEREAEGNRTRARTGLHK